MYDVEAIKAYHEALIKARDEAVANALAHREDRLNFEIEQAKKEILATLDEVLVREAEAPYKAEIEQLNKFVVPDAVPDETPSTEE